MSGKTWKLLAVVALLAGGCGGSGDGGEGGMTKDDARGGKGDVSGDLCEENDWYGDGECDDFCSRPDPDCGDAGDAVVIDASGDGQTFTAIEGQQVVVRLAANPSTGYRWVVAAVDRTFGYPSSDEIETTPNGPVGSGGAQVLTWETTSGIETMVGTHHVTLEYRRPWDENVDPEDSFSFTVEVVAADGGSTGEIALSLGEEDDGGTFEVAEGGLVEVRLPSNPSTGYDWMVTAVDRTFGYPEISYEAGNGAVGSGGTTVLVWQTSGFLSMIGTHAVELGYRRAWEDESVPSARTFTFTLEITE